MLGGLKRRQDVTEQRLHVAGGEASEVGRPARHHLAPPRRSAKSCEASASVRLRFKWLSWASIQSNGGKAI